MQDEQVQLFSPDNLIDPYPVYKQLRDADPVYYLPELNLHVVTRYDLLREAIKRADDFSSRFDVFFETTRQMAFKNLSESQRAQAGGGPLFHPAGSAGAACYLPATGNGAGLAPHIH